VQWRSILDIPAEAVARECRAADLVVIGNANDNIDQFQALDSAITILKAGRPVLVVPKALSSFSPGRVAVAWKDTREARRAVRDALPFMQRAETVVIVEILGRRKDIGRRKGQ